MASGSDDERVAVRILEECRRAPGLLLRRLRELDAARHELLVRLLDVVGAERDVAEGADAVLLPRRTEERDTGLRAWDLQLDPAEAGAHGLIGHDLEPHLLGPEGESTILITNGDGDELDALEHGGTIRQLLARARPRPLMSVHPDYSA